MEVKKITYQNAKICYRVTGNGKPVLLLHGFGEDGNVWQPQVDFLKNYFRLIIPDIPGSGLSDVVTDANIDTYADIIKQVIDAEFTNPAFQIAEELVIIGHSMGGYITLAFAEKYPGYLTSFGLFHSSAFSDNEEKKQARLKAIDFVTANGAHAFLKTSIPGLFTKLFAENFPERIEALIEAGKNFSPEALIQYYQAMITRPDRREVLKTFPRPILFIIGEHDTAIPFQISLQQCYLPVQSHVHILTKSGHMGMWEETGKANELLLQFLQ